MLAGAAAWDLWTHKIPNWWLGFWLVQILFPLLGAGASGILQFLAGAAIAATVTGIGFYFRIIGAGDSKLIALMCGYLGIGRGFQTAAAGFIIGAIWSLGKLIYYRQARRRLGYFIAWLRQSIQTQERIPYFQKDRGGDQAVIPLAVCFLGGFLVTVFMRK